MLQLQERRIDVIEAGAKVRDGAEVAQLGSDIEFSTDALRSYLLAKWEPLIYDAMVVAAAVEFADRISSRSSKEWKRQFSIRLPVHDLSRWNGVAKEHIQNMLGFLTGDGWNFEFVKRLQAECFPHQDPLNLPVPIQAVIPYSDGMDSRAVAGILKATLGDELLCVRVGKKDTKQLRGGGKFVPFIGVPYSLNLGSRAKESTARSRGFKFLLISGIAAYLSSARRIIMPESGQGSIGPALVTVAHAYPDFRNHPLFTMRMEKFLKSLFGMDVNFDFPRLWHTKAQTLREFASLPGGVEWADTKTCWYDNRGSSVKGKFRNCGICAACMLRRMSVHAAGLSEVRDAYVTVTLSATSLAEAVDPDFKNLNKSFEHYGIAGALSLKNLADMASDQFDIEIRRHAALLAYALGKPQTECNEGLVSLLQRHSEEWQAFSQTLGESSFINTWTRDAA